MDNEPSHRGQWSEGVTIIVFLWARFPRRPPRICLELPAWWLFSNDFTTLEPNILRSSFSAFKYLESTCNIEGTHCLTGLPSSFGFAALVFAGPPWWLEELVSKEKDSRIASKGFSTLSALDREPSLPLFFFFFLDLWLDVETTSTLVSNVDGSSLVIFTSKVSSTNSESSPCSQNDH